MFLKAIINSTLCIYCLNSAFVYAQGKNKNQDIKELSGISIIGNKEAPKSLYIVPWEDSSVGVATSLKSDLLDNTNRSIDKEVFLRELDFYNLSHSK